MQCLYLLCLTITIFFYSSFAEDIDTDVDIDDSDIGTLELGSRILHGRVAKPMTFPFQVSLQEETKANTFKFCGGVIIKPKWILTAAHCYYDDIKNGKFQNDFRVKAGVVKANDLGPTSQFVPVKKIHIHPQYNNITILNDIALLQLKYPLKFNKYVKPIGLPPYGYKAKGSGTIVGWGAIDHAERVSSSVLRFATIPVSKREDCDEFFENSLKKSQLCLGVNSKYNACAGDSGGPFVQIIKGKPAVVGITSFGTSGCYEDDPIVYTDVASHLDFIKKTVVGKSVKSRNDADRISHPYLVSLLDYDELEESYEKFCTGVIVHEKWVLTAADCFDNENKNRMSYIRIKVASNDVDSSEDKNLLEISKFIPHPMYKIDDKDGKFNVALVKLKKPVSSIENTEKAFLPPSYFDLSAVQGKIIGWEINNSTEDDGLGYQLVTSDVTNGDPAVCKKHFPNQSEATICVIRLGDTCNFDTSSPLIVPNSNGNFLLGLNAVVDKNCEENKPFLVSNMLYFSEFIDNVISKKPVN